MGHNQEDLFGLGKIISMLSYLTLFKEDYDVLNCEIINDQLIFTMEIPYILPAKFSKS